MKKKCGELKNNNLKNLLFKIYISLVKLLRLVKFLQKFLVDGCKASCGSQEINSRKV